MPSAAQHTSSDIVKMLLIGDSGSGKTGALVSLVKAGYKLRIVDMDNGLDSLVNLCKRMCPDKLDNINYQTFRDKTKMTGGGPVLDGMPKAFVSALQCIENWPEGLGKPETWGTDTVLVIDSLTFLSNAAMNWSAMVKVPSGAKGQDGRAVVGEAQRALESVIATVTAESFKVNLIVTAHISYNSRVDGTTKGFPNAAGEKLGPKLLGYFNSYAAVERSQDKRIIRTEATHLLDLKNPASFSMPAAMPVETGLADFFKTLKGELKPK